MHRGARVAQRLDGIRERGRLDDGMVAGLQHHAGQQRQRLLRSARHHQFRVGVALQAARGGQARQFVAQAGLAVDVGILQAGAQAGQDLRRRDRQALHIEQLLRGVAARKRNRARPHGVGHERSDGGCGGIQERRGKGVFWRSAGHGGGLERWETVSPEGRRREGIEH
ncbi:hypothetical protein G6F22_018618 [Rhizopus arrhizus]|nr:hypothetical protein G6F22_018618 [Rhizopus arrhizus]